MVADRCNGPAALNRSSDWSKKFHIDIVWRFVRFLVMGRFITRIVLVSTLFLASAFAPAKSAEYEVGAYANWGTCYTKVLLGSEHLNEWICHGTAEIVGKSVGKLYSCNRWLMVEIHQNGSFYKQNDNSAECHLSIDSPSLSGMQVSSSLFSLPDDGAAYVPIGYSRGARPAYWWHTSQGQAEACIGVPFLPTPPTGLPYFSSGAFGVATCAPVVFK